MERFRRGQLVIASLAAILIGCSGGNTAGYKGPKPVPAKGKVSYKNQPVEGATVSFLGSRAAIAVTDASGEFILTTVTSGDGAVPGDHKVTVTKIVAPPSAAKKAGNMSMEDAAKAAQEPPAAKPLSLLPDKYASAESSGLQYTVKSGDKNEFNIELTD